jgi:TAP-like protein
MNNFSICQFWKVQPVPASQKVAVKSSIPTLILQGEYDPVTPPTNGMLTAQTLSRNYFILFPGVGHGVTSPTNCPNSIMNAFLNNPTVKPDSSCINIMTEPFFA